MRSLDGKNQPNTALHQLHNTGQPISDKPAIQNALNEADASRYIGYSRSFLRKDRCEGHRRNRTPGPAYIKIGRAVRYLLSDLDAWLLAHRVTRRDPTGQIGGESPED